MLGERLVALPSQLLGGQPPVALHSSAGEHPQGPFPLSCPPHEAHATTALGAPCSAPTLQSLQSPGRSWETPARCPEKGVGRESQAGTQLSRASLSQARPSPRAPAAQESDPQESDQWLRQLLATAHSRAGWSLQFRMGPGSLPQLLLALLPSL